jgi:hypothetical protein
MWLEYLTSSLLNRVVPGQSLASPPGLLLGHAIDPPHAAVVLPDRHRCEHAVIVGKTGSGKTYLLERLAADLAKRGEGFAFFDFHGDASLSVIGRLSRMPEAAGRLVIVDPSHPTRSPGINVLESGRSEAERFRKVAELSSILRQRWGVDSFGARTEELLRSSLYTLAGNDCTLADLPRLLAVSEFRRRLTEQLDHPDIADYWRSRYEPLSEAMKAVFREPLLNKVTGFLTEPAARHLLGQPESTIDIGDVMRRRQWLIIRLPKGRLRDHAHTLGNLIFAQLQFAAFARERVPQTHRQPFTLLCDEVQNLAENDLSALVTEGRKFGIAVITANQFWEQLPRELRGCLLSAASHICFRVSSADAHVLASELSLERRVRLTLDLTNLDRGEAIARLGNNPVVRFRVPKASSSSQVTANDLDRLLIPVTRLRADIEQRIREAAQPATPTSRVHVEPAKGESEGHDGW